MAEIRVSQKRGIKGVLIPPPDKSISHRALIISSLSKGKSLIKNLSRGEDCLRTKEIIQSLGIEIEGKEEGLIINGKGLFGFTEPEDILDCGNSGTTMRLISGVLSGQNFYSVLTGDKSLRRRPMKRVIQPLSAMGAKIQGRKKGDLPPLTICGAPLSGVDYSLPVASAQVKSCLIFAGLLAKGRTSIKEPVLSRDHTERMLTYFGAGLKKEGHFIKVEGRKEFLGSKLDIPGDFSSASFFLGGALLLQDSELKVENVNLNPTRTGLLKVLLRMGASIRVIEKGEKNNEPFGDIEVTGSSSLKGIKIEEEIIPTLIDEIPILSVVASLAKGRMEIRGAKELRFKETDRLKALSTELRKLGAKIEEREDGLIIEGVERLRGAKVSSYGDHRIAMALTVAGLVAEGETVVDDTSCISTSFPEFEEKLNRLVNGVRS